ncbi:hypothetical protein B5S25_22650 (plasmid) [Paenibacillus larvae subsp. pulvifaciens]|nr:hypothetical protein B5S25_22650 [Paenibacillus larvae subsp. pulvifaciens]
MCGRHQTLIARDRQKFELHPVKRKTQGGRPAKVNRQMLNAMLWVIGSGAPWRDLPEYYGPWQSVYTRLLKINQYPKKEKWHEKTRYEHSC